MAETIDYFFTHSSPWAFLGHAAFLDLASRHGVAIRLRPVDLAMVFEASGGLPLNQRHAQRRAYRFVELQRWALKRGLPMNFKPKHFPVPAALADCCAIVLADRAGRPGGYCEQVMRAVWLDDKNIADEAVLAVILTVLGEDAAAVIAQARGDEALAAYRNNEMLAIDLGVIGSPCYVWNGEPFWGQDRLDLLEDALISGRKPFKPL
ncbi:MAG: 2-hydroxychromene-2-carboxylate isomerase [Roseibium sp.]|nr:2-hydroxychromene-2-carboxylate isomerase [Roseibium sp.]